jgi:cation diffusion facilitator family transporter
MAHHRKMIGAAVGVNTAIVVVEASAGFQANSLSLLMDSLHNLSDELALVFLFLAYVVSTGLSRNMLRSANFLNSVGLIVMSGLLLWHAASRILTPQPVLGWLPALVGLAAAAANWGVARLLVCPSADNPAVRLAYIHNLGDGWVSLAPVVAGILVTVSGQSFFDPFVASLIGLWILGSTLREVMGSRESLIWPQKIVCGHATEQQP